MLDERNTKVGRVWLYIYGLVGCDTYHSWNKRNKTENIEFIDKMVNTLKERNQTFGFFTDKYNWHEITGNTRKYNNTPLFYSHMDGKNNFDDYNEFGYPFGDWEKPTIEGI
uniref:Candidate secreted effector n=1 Tax=Meloidogyne incognita TaxID=6306 RepID=A0A914KW35_MELIC